MANTSRPIRTDPSDTAEVQTSSKCNLSACPPRKPLSMTPVHVHDPNSDVVQSNKELPIADAVAAAHNTKALRHRKKHMWLRVLIDISLAVLPCLFIALGIIAAYLNGRPSSLYGQRVEEAARLGPTIFPIVFAAIVARFNRHLAHWQAERGQYLGVRTPIPVNTVLVL